MKRKIILLVVGNLVVITGIVAGLLFWHTRSIVKLQQTMMEQTSLEEPEEDNPDKMTEYIDHPIFEFGIEYLTYTEPENLDEDEAVYAAAGDVIALPADVTNEMLSPEFWLNEDADDIIMDLDEIKAFDKKVMSQFKRVEVMFDLKNYPATCSGSTVKRIAQAATPLGRYSYLGKEKASTEYKNSIKAARELDKVPSKVTTRYAIAVDRTNVRGFPTADPVTDDSYNLYYDELQYSELYMSEPVVVLHTTEAGDWHFVLSDRMFGWVEDKYLAFCEDREEWLSWQNEENILVVTAKKMVLDLNPYDPDTRQCSLTMGTVLQLATEAESARLDYHRKPYSCYTVKLPVRGEEGEIQATYAYVPVGEDVSVGYIPYTRRNIVTQSFKMMGTAYGWGGINDATDCSGYANQVYRCFGFRFPRNSTHQAHMPGQYYDISKRTDAEKEALLDTLPTGTLLRFPGHIMIYLGKNNGKYFVISALGTFIPSDSEKMIVETPRGIMINGLDVLRKNKDTWLTNLTDVCVVENP